MKNSVKDKVYIVTGGGSGIGRELVMELLRRGANVAALDINQDTLKETFELSRVSEERLSLHVVDVSNRKDVSELPEKIIKHHKQIDGLINNAGIIQPFVKFIKLKDESVDRVMNINLYGVLNLTKTFLPILIERPSSNIVNVSSMGGFLPVPGQGIYGASKAAVKLFTEALYAETIDTNVHVSVVFPGAIATNISSNSNKLNNNKEGGVDVESLSKGKSSMTTSPDAAARIIINGIEKNKLRIFVGNDAKLMDFLYRLTPKKAINLMYYMLKKMGVELN